MPDWVPGTWGGCSLDLSLSRCEDRSQAQEKKTLVCSWNDYGPLVQEPTVLHSGCRGSFLALIPLCLPSHQFLGVSHSSQSQSGGCAGISSLPSPKSRPGGLNSTDDLQPGHSDWLIDHQVRGICWAPRKRSFSLSRAHRDGLPLPPPGAAEWSQGEGAGLQDSAVVRIL